MNASEILEEWLQEHGYDGLVDVDTECYCVIGDLLPCHSYCRFCEPGYTHKDGLVYRNKEEVCHDENQSRGKK